jgi:hypothetical protein
LYGGAASPDLEGVVELIGAAADAVEEFAVVPSDNLREVRIRRKCGLAHGGGEGGRREEGRRSLTILDLRNSLLTFASK